MKSIYICGHRNPDTDSVCSAFCYADLKNKLSREDHYDPIRCGRLTPQTRLVFEMWKQTPPELRKDIYPKVGEVVPRNDLALFDDEPVFTAIRMLDENNISVIPVFSRNSEFKGLISIHEISRFLLTENPSVRPVHKFFTDNFDKVVPGFIYHQGSDREFHAPIMTGAMPYELSLEHISALEQKPLLILGLRPELLEIAVKQQFPGIILSGVNKTLDFPVSLDNYKGTIFISHTDTAETIRRIRLSTPLSEIVDSSAPHLDKNDNFEMAKNLLVNSRYRGLPVFDGSKFFGTVTRRCFIEEPRKTLILVDHNETSQSVEGAEKAMICEILDHHKLGIPRTKEPIYVYARPVGSTCTLIYTHYRMFGIQIEPEIAGLLLAGILADTVILKSPTATDEDRKAAWELASICGVDIEVYGGKLFQASAADLTKDLEKTIISDFKIYNEKGYFIGISQVEVSTLQDIPANKKNILDVLETMKEKKNLDWGLLLLTDVVKRNSLLISTSFNGAEEKLFYTPVEPHLYDLPGILSRKKQLLPEIMRVLEELPPGANGE